MIIRFMVLMTLMVMFATQAEAKRHHREKPVKSTVTEFCGERYGTCYDGMWPNISTEERAAPQRTKRVKHHESSRVHIANYSTESSRIVPKSIGSSLVEKARAYLGTNPTGWKSLWCGRFMAMIAPLAAHHVKNPNLARAWAVLRHIAPRIGAIAVLSRGSGGHVGVVSGFDDRGNPRIISGNHGHRVGEGFYPKRRVIAYVDPSA